MTKTVKDILFVFIFTPIIILQNDFARPSLITNLGSIQSNIDSLFNSVKNLNENKSAINNYARFILNNKISPEKELKKINSLNNSVYKNYLASLVLKKQENFNEMYSVLIPLLNKKNNYLPIYDELVFSARASDKLDSLLIIIKNGSNKHKDYILSLIYFAQGDYKKALTYIESFQKKEKLQPEMFYKLSYIFRNLGNYKKAFDALRKYRGDDWITDKKLLAEGSLHFLSGNYDEAFRLYNKGYEIAEKINDNQTKATALVNISIINDMSGNLKKARNGFIRAAKLADKINDIEIKAFALSELGVSFSFTNQLIEARENYLGSFNLYNLTNNKLRLALLSNNIAKIYLQLFEYNSALKYFNNGIKYSGSNKRALAMNYLGLADTYTNLSNYSKAMEYYKKSKNISSKIKELSLRAEINSGLGALYFNINKLNDALNFYKKSIRFYDKNNDTYSSSGVYQKLGRIYFKQKSFNKAIESLRKSLTLSRQNQDIYNEAVSTLDLAQLYYEKGDTPKSETLLSDFNKIIAKNNFKYLKARSLLIRGKIYRRSNKNKLAESFFKRSFLLAKSLKEYNLEIESLYHLAETNMKLRNNANAEEFYMKANNLIIKISNPLIVNNNIQVSYFSSKEEVYTSYAKFLLSQNKIKKAFEVIDNSRARNTQQLLNNLKLREVIKNKKTLNKLLDYSWILNSGLYKESKKDSIKKIIYSLAGNESNGISRLLGEGKFLSLTEIQEKLNGDENIISQFSTKEKTYLFRITKDTFDYSVVDLSANELNNLLEKVSPFYKSKIGNIKTFNQDLFSFNVKAAYELYKKLFAPVIKEIPKGQKIIYSPSFNVQSFPVEFLITKYDSALSDYNYSDKNFLIFDYSILYTSSAHTYIKQKEKRANNKGEVLVVGDPFINYKSDEFATRRSLFSKTMGFLPLKYSLQEIDEINSIINVDKLLEGENATETKFKQSVKNSKLIHLSTHSFLYNKQPVIFFSNEKDKKNDGYLELNEIIGLNLNADLVVLSSCNSGLGVVDRSEGVMGMTKAFFEAGSKSVMVSLWEVNDKYTSSLMKYFYEFLSRGKNKSDALRLAKIKFIKNDSPNPYFWSTFIISGNNEAMSFGKGSLSKYYLLVWAGLIIFSLFAIYIQIKKRRTITV